MSRSVIPGKIRNLLFTPWWRHTWPRFYDVFYDGTKLASFSEKNSRRVWEHVRASFLDKIFEKGFFNQSFSTKVYSDMTETPNLPLTLIWLWRQIWLRCPKRYIDVGDGCWRPNVFITNIERQAPTSNIRHQHQICVTNIKYPSPTSKICHKLPILAYYDVGVRFNSLRICLKMKKFGTRLNFMSAT